MSADNFNVQVKVTPKAQEFQQDLQKVADKIIVNVNVKMSGQQGVKDLNKDLKDLDKNSKKATDSAKNLGNSLNQVDKDSKSLGQSFGDIVTKVGKFYLATKPIQMMQQAFDEALQSVKDFDDAMTDLRKVSDLDGQSLTDYTIKLGELGEAVYRSRTEMTEAAVLFKQTGASDEDAAKLAQLANLYMNVADNEMTAADASAYITSQMKAFKITANDAITILDKTNEVSNKFAVSSSDISRALTTSSSSLAVYGNDINETMALVTAGAEIMTGKSRQVGRGLRSIGANISALASSAGELKFQVNGATETISLIDEETGDMINTFQALSEIHKYWDKMTASEKAALATTLSGKTQMDVFSSVLSNFNTAIEANTVAVESNGSAWEENNKRADSLGAKLNLLKSQFQELILGDGGLQSFGKALLDVGISILKFANSDVGQTIIQLTLLVTSLNLVAKGFEALKISTKALGIVTLIKDVASLKAGMQTVVSSQLALDIVTKGLTKTFIANAAAWLTTPMGMATAIAVGVFALIKVVDALTVSFDEQVEKLEEVKSAYESTKTELENITEQLKQVRDRIDEINNKDELSIIEESQLRLLKEQEASLEHQLILQQELNKEAKDQATTEAKKTLSKTFESAEAFGVTTDYFQSGMPVTTVGKGTLTEAIDSLNQKMAEEQDSIDSLIAKRNELEASNQKESAEYNELGAQLDTHIQERDELRATTAEYVKTMDEAISVADQEDETVKGAISIRDAYDAIVKRIIGTEEEAQNQANQTGDALDDENDEVESLDESLKKLAQSVGLSVEELTNLANTLGVTNEVAAQIQSSLNDWNDTVDDIQSAYQTLASAVEEYNTQGYYSTDTIQSLLALSPEYLGMLQEENGKIVLNEEAIRNKVIAQAEEAKQIAYDTAIKRLNAIASGDTATATEKAGEASKNASSKHTKNAQALMGEAKANLYLATAEARRRGLGTAESEIQTILSDLSTELATIDKWSESIGKSFEGSMGKVTKSTNKATNAINQQKQALQNAKKALQEERDAKVKDVENQLKTIEREYKASKKAIEAQRDAEINSIEKQIDAIEKEREARKKYWEEQLSNLEAQNQAVEDAIDLQQKLSDLAKAQQTQKMILKDGRFVYSSDESAVTEAQQNLDDFLRQKEYEKQKAYLEKMRDTEDENYSQRLDVLNEFKDERKTYYDKLLDDLQNNYEQSKQSLEDYKDALKENYDNQINDLENHADALSSQYSAMLSSQKSYQDSSLSSLRSYVNDYNNTLSNLSGANPNLAKGSAAGMPTNVPTYKKVYNNKGKKITSTGTGKKGSGGMPSNVPTYKKLYAHANGVGSVGSDQVALVGDNPKYRELVIGSKLNNDQGTLMRLSSGSGVVNADSTKTLASIFNSLSGQINSAPFANNGANNGTTISIGSISLPEVKDGQGFVDYMQHFSTDITQQSFNRV